MNEHYKTNEIRESPRSFRSDLEQWCWQLGWFGLTCGVSYVLGGPFGPTLLPKVVGVSVLLHFFARALRWANHYEEIQQANSLQQEGQLIEAFVINRWSNYDSEGGTTYALAYQFPGGELTAHYLGTNQRQWDALSPGSRILVLYTPSNPAWSQVVTITSGYQLLDKQRAKLFPRRQLNDLWPGLSNVCIGEQFTLPISVVQESEKQYASFS